MGRPESFYARNRARLRRRHIRRLCRDVPELRGLVPGRSASASDRWLRLVFGITVIVTVTTAAGIGRL